MLTLGHGHRSWVPQNRHVTCWPVPIGIRNLGFLMAYSAPTEQDRAGVPTEQLRNRHWLVPQGERPPAMRASSCLAGTGSPSVSALPASCSHAGLHLAG